jgi:hypothetical protein
MSEIDERALIYTCPVCTVKWNVELELVHEDELHVVWAGSCNSGHEYTLEHKKELPYEEE